MAKSIIYNSQIDLPVAADHEKSPIRKQEFDSHIDSEQHIQNDGAVNQMLVMTAVGPRMMTPKVTCDGFDYLHYSCECNIFFDDTPDADFQFIVLKNNIQDVPDVGQLNYPSFRLTFDSTSDYFRFIPVKVYDCDLSQLTYSIVDNTAASMIGVQHLIDGKSVYDFSLDRIGKHFNDAIVIGIVGRPYYYISIEGM